MHKSKFAATVAAGLALALLPAHAAAGEAAKPVSLGVAFDHTAAGDPQGPEVTSILPDRNGAALGFEVGDILVEVGGKSVDGIEVLRDYLKERKAGDRLNFKVKRAGAVVELIGTALAAPERAPPPAAQ